jgi:hypothetical protein
MAAAGAVGGGVVGIVKTGVIVAVLALSNATTSR